jgi:hypothetical protein
MSENKQKKSLNKKLFKKQKVIIIVFSLKKANNK